MSGKQRQGKWIEFKISEFEIASYVCVLAFTLNWALNLLRILIFYSTFILELIVKTSGQNIDVLS